MEVNIINHFVIVTAAVAEFGIQKKIDEKFGGSEKSSTFATLLKIKGTRSLKELQ